MPVAVIYFHTVFVCQCAAREGKDVYSAVLCLCISSEVRDDFFFFNILLCSQETKAKHEM